MSQMVGIVLCVLGGFGVGVFLLPLKYSKYWTWENSWLVGAFFMYIVLPIGEASLLVPNFVQIFRVSSSKDFWMIYVFGLIQGSGALVFTYGITLMGLSLGYSLMISLIAASGVLVPLFVGHPDQILALGGITLITGVTILIIGVVFSGKAGRMRERAAGAKAKIRNFSLVVLIALYSGIANSFFYFSFEFQKGIKYVATNQFHVSENLWPVVNVIPLFTGMFSISLVYCVIKMAKSGALKNYCRGKQLGLEFLLALAIGILWFLGQGVCYTIGFTMLGTLGVPVGAAIFMGSMILFSNALGLKTGEWKLAEPQVLRWMYAGIAFEILAVAVVGLGNHFAMLG